MATQPYKSSLHPRPLSTVTEAMEVLKLQLKEARDKAIVGPTACPGVSQFMIPTQAYHVTIGALQSSFFFNYLYGGINK